jgi:hypothetical protein
MMRFFAAIAVSVAALTVGGASAQQRGNLEIYWIDVEGGASTLFVAPDGESLLFDTGYTGNGDRDAQRIFAAAQRAGLKAHRPRRDQSLACGPRRRARCALEAYSDSAFLRSWRSSPARGQSAAGQLQIHCQRKSHNCAGGRYDPV